MPKMLQFTSSQNKMASYHSYTSEEVLAEIFADPDSDFDGESSSDESYSTQRKFFQRAQNHLKVMKATNGGKMTLKKIHPDLHKDVVMEVVVDGLDNTTALLKCFNDFYLSI